MIGKYERELAGLRKASSAARAAKRSWRSRRLIETHVGDARR
ncbi:hypothetical protein AB0L00_11020 [Actinoallomurus sp. NPDC052308]